MNFNNIILIGFMGSGKSSIGKRLARHLHYHYLDTDELIVSKTGRSVATLFESQGEPAFREIETEVLQDLSEEKNMVLSTGGGILLSLKNREILRSLGVVLWLHADADTLFERATRNNRRPLLNVENPRRTFNALLEARRSLYETASHLDIDTSHLSYEQTMTTIINALSITRP